MAMVMADDLAAARGTLAVGPTVEGLIAGVLEPDADRRARLAAGLAHPAWPERVAAGPVVLMARGLASGPGAVADGPHLLAGDLRLDNRDDLCRALGECSFESANRAVSQTEHQPRHVGKRPRGEGRSM